MNAKKNHRNITVIALVLVLVSGAFLTEAVQSSTLNAPLALETPTDIGLSSTTVAENEPSGTVVGTLSTVDADVGDSFTYTLVTGDGDDDNTSFSIVGDELWTGAFFNFEVKNSYSVRIRTTDMDALSFEKAFTITVTDVNEAPTDISLNATSVEENQPAGTVVGTLNTVDPDAGDTFTYDLVAGNGDTDNASFSIVGNDLRTAVPFNYEVKDSYSVRIGSTDGAMNSFEKEFTITITDVADGPTDISLDSEEVPENSPMGTAVGTLSTIDPTVGDTFTYSLVAGTGDTDNTSFSIDGDEVKTGASFNYEVKDTYSIRVRSTDADGLPFDKPFTILVTNVSENEPTGIDLDTNEVEENQPIGTVVGTLSTTDTDIGDSFTYSFAEGDGDDDNASFSIVGDELKTAESFNYEVKKTYSIRVRSTDADMLPVEAEFTITVTDVDDAPTDINLSNTTVAENQPTGTVVGTLSTIDPVLGDTFTYELADGDGGDDNASFDIDGDELITEASFNFETKSSYSVRILSTDSDGLEYDEAFTITIDDVNENPTDINLSSTSVAENQPAGTVVGTFSTTDPDAGDTFTYELVTGDGSTDNASFEIEGDTLKTMAVFDRETKSTYTIRVQTSDSGSLTLPKQLTITIANVNEAPVAVADLNYQMRQGEIMNLAKALDGVLANDVDVDHDVLYAVLVTPPEQIESEDDFLLRPDGTFYYKPDPDYVSRSTDPKPYDSFTYYVTDRESGGLTSNTVEVRIEVLDANSPTVAWVLPITNDEDTFFVDTETVLLQAEATDNVAVRRVRFYRWKPDETDPLKGRFIDIASVETKPYQTILDVSTLDLQYNQVFVEAYDNMGNKSQRQRILMYRTSQVLFPYQLFMPGVLHTRAVSVP